MIVRRPEFDCFPKDIVLSMDAEQIPLTGFTTLVRHTTVRAMGFIHHQIGDEHYFQHMRTIHFPQGSFYRSCKQAIAQLEEAGIANQSGIFMN